MKTKKENIISASILPSTSVQCACFYLNLCGLIAVPTTKLSAYPIECCVFLSQSMKPFSFLPCPATMLACYYEPGYYAYKEAAKCRCVDSRHAQQGNLHFNLFEGGIKLLG